MDNTSSPSRRRFLAGASRVAAVAAVLQTFGPAHAFDENSVNEVNLDAKGLALQGYDPVSYFKQSGPVRGQERYSAQYGGATYRFVNAKNRDVFRADPAKFVPAYGGFCAMGVALNKKLDVDPHAWRIVDGRLYLNVHKDAQKRWLDDVPGNIRQADLNWPRLKALAPKSL